MPGHCPGELPLNNGNHGITYFVAQAGWARVQRVAVLSTITLINPHQDAILPVSRFMEHVVKNGETSKFYVKFHDSKRSC